MLQLVEFIMVPKKIIVGLVGMSFAALLPMSAMAQPLGTVEGLPFFGHPFPYGFAYHPQRDECYAPRVIDTPEGPRVQEVYVCGAPVTARY